VEGFLGAGSFFVVGDSELADSGPGSLSAFSSAFGAGFDGESLTMLVIDSKSHDPGDPDDFLVLRSK
jgi:hypothetical protein